jgi:hypothetical protein
VSLALSSSVGRGGCRLIWAWGLCDIRTRTM